MKSAGTGWRLAALALAVAAVHIVLLGGARQVRPEAPPIQPRALVTRTIALAPAVPVAPHAQSVAAVSAPPKRERRRPEPATQAIVLASSPAPAPAPAQAAPAGRAESPTAATPPAAPSAPAAPSSAAPAAAFRIPAAVRLHYRVEARSRGITLQGQSELHWRHDGDSYDARLEVSAPLLPTRRQHSTGEITAAGLAPLRFSDKARSEEAAHFQRDKGTVSFSNNRPDAPLAAGAQDRLSVLLQLGAMIAGDPRRFPAGTTIPIQTASTREAEAWHFTVEGEEPLHLPGGTVPSLKLIRLPRKEFDQTVELWLGPGMDYVPVRLRLTQPNGDWVDQQWASTDKG